MADPRGTLQLNGQNLRYGDDVLGNLQAAVNVQNLQATVKASAPKYALAVDGSLGVEQPHPVKFTARLQGTDLSVLPIKNPPAGKVQAEISGGGVLGDLKNANVTARVQNLTLTARGQTIRNEGPMTIGYQNQRVSLDSVKLTSGQSSVELRGSIPLDPQAESGSVTLAANVDLATVSSLLPQDSGIKAAGRLTANGTVTGNLKELAPNVELRLNNGSVTVPQLREPVSQVSLAAHIQPEQATIDTLQAHVGSGAITAQAKVPYGVLPGNLPLRKGAGTGEIKAGIQNFDMRSLVALPPEAQGKVSVDIQAQAPRPDLKAATGTVKFGDLALDVKGLEFHQAVPTTITLADGRATVSQLRLAGKAPVCRRADRSSSPNQETWTSGHRARSIRGSWDSSRPALRRRDRRTSRSQPRGRFPNRFSTVFLS